MSSFAVRLKRLRETPPSRLWPVLKPQHFDQILFRTDRAPEQLFESEHAIQRFDEQHKSGVPDIDRRLVRNRLCYAIFDNSELIHNVWVDFDTLLPSRFGFEFGVPMLGGGFTVPHARGRGLQKFTLAYAIRDLLASGYKQVYTMVSPHNEPSLRSVHKVGFVPVARLRGWSFAGMVSGRAEPVAA